MRLSFVQAYPVFHDGHTLEEWLAIRNRDRFMPAAAADLGHEVELLAVGRERRSLASQGPGLEGYRIEIFPSDDPASRPRAHVSRALLEHARRRDAAVHFVKGIDGGAGISVMRDYLLPARKPFAMVVGGKYYNRWVGRADLVLCETTEQQERLRRPGLRVWRRRFGDAEVAVLPKSIDTDEFRPAAAGEEKLFEVILVGRLLSWKGFDAVAPIAVAHRVVVVGGGPEEFRLRRCYPAVQWLGRRSHAEVAKLLRRARLLYHPGRYDYYPRAVAEAFACGVPVVAIAGGVSRDAVPPGTGLVVPASEAPSRIGELLADGGRLAVMGLAAREHAVRDLGPESSRDALKLALARLAPGT